MRDENVSIRNGEISWSPYFYVYLVPNSPRQVVFRLRSQRPRTGSTQSLGSCTSGGRGQYHHRRRRLKLYPGINRIDGSKFIGCLRQRNSRTPSFCCPMIPLLIATVNQSSAKKVDSRSDIYL